MAKRTCNIEGCTDTVAGRGWCSMHYQRWKNNGDPLIVKRRFRQAPVCERRDCGKPGFMRGLCLPHYRDLQKAERGPCSVDGCAEPWAARGLCVVHYRRFQRTGSTDAPKMAGRPCSADGCDDRVRAHDLCEKHYKNQRKYGTPYAPPRRDKVWLPCSQDGCTELATRRNGMCNRHYRADIATAKPQCSMPSCTKAARRGGFCEPHGGWTWHLYKRYGITRERYDASIEAQGGLCAICRRPPEAANDRVKRLVVDHDHGCCPGDTSCGKCVRGLLCVWCNRLLGMAMDDAERLLAAVRYLQATAGAVQLSLAI